MRGKIFLLLIPMLFLLVFSVFGASNITISAPVTSGAVRGSSYTLKALVGYNQGEAVKNVTWWAFCSNTANNTYVWLASNETGNKSAPGSYNFTATFNSSLFEDSSQCTFNASLTWTNTSGTYYDDSIATSVIIDNTVPVAPTNLKPTSEDSKVRNIKFTATVDDPTTTGCTFNIPRQHISGTMTYSGSSCSYTVTKILQEGKVKYEVVATDGLNTTKSTQILDLHIPRSSTKKTLIAQQIEEAKKPKMLAIATEEIAGIPAWLLVVLLVVVISSIIYLKRK